jgi:hypothetical protein
MIGELHMKHIEVSLSQLGYQVDRVKDCTIKVHDRKSKLSGLKITYADEKVLVREYLYFVDSGIILAAQAFFTLWVAHTWMTFPVPIISMQLALLLFFTSVLFATLLIYTNLMSMRAIVMPCIAAIISEGAVESSIMP